MFSIKLVDSFISHLKSEGVSSFLALYQDVSKEKISDLALPILSNAYFSAGKSFKSTEFKSLEEYSSKRLKGCVGVRFSDAQIPLTQQKELENLSTKAIDLISRSWEPLLSLVKIISPRINKTNNNETFESASDPSSFGEILYRMNSNSYIKWAEIYAHELGHHYLNIILTTKSNQEVFEQPWSSEDHSAIRDMSRPLIGIYHGAFAESCMLIFASKVLESELTSEFEKKEAKKILNKFSSIFQKDYNILKKYNLLDFDLHIKEFLETAKEVTL